MSEPRMIRACDAGPTHPAFEKHFPDLRCDREERHGGPHRQRDWRGGDCWWHGGAIGMEEGFILESMRDAEKHRAREARAAERKAKREAAKSKVQP